MARVVCRVDVKRTIFAGWLGGKSSQPYVMP